jgi:hypothetical protein
MSMRTSEDLRLSGDGNACVDVGSGPPAQRAQRSKRATAPVRTAELSSVTGMTILYREDRP